MKKVTSLILVLLLLLALTVSAMAFSGSVSLKASGTNLKRGDTFTVTASLNSADAIALGTVKLDFDSSVFELTGGSCHVSGASLGQVIVGSKVGTFMFSGDPQRVSGAIFTFNMKVKDTAGFGSFTISSSSAIGVSNGEPISSGSVTVAVVCEHSYGSFASTGDAQHSRVCSICKNEEKADHSWDKGTVTVKPSCKEAGEKTYTCSVCSATRTEKLDKTEDHVFGDLTSVDGENHKDTCSVCRKEIVQPHTWNKGVVTKKATCKEAGEKTYTCTGCAATKTEGLPKSEKHKFGTWKKTDDTEHKRVCSVCQLEETGTHTYKTTWSKDANEHWHACSVCKDKKDTEKHQPGPEPTETEAQTCKKCDYIIKAALGHTHSYATTWTTDESGHWYVCSGCEEKGSFAAHDFENDCDPDCSVCGYTRETAHTYSEVWESDGQNHWHACSGCGEKTDQDVHIPGAQATATTAQTCTICGYELAPALGEAATEPAGTIEGPIYEPPFPWWIIPLLIAAVAMVALIVVIKKSR